MMCLSVDIHACKLQIKPVGAGMHPRGGDSSLYLNVIWQTPPPSNVAQSLKDDSWWHPVLMLENITAISLMEARLTKGQDFT